MNSALLARLSISRSLNPSGPHQNLPQPLRDNYILARLQHNRTNPDGAAAPMMSASAENYRWLHGRELSIYLACANRKLVGIQMDLDS